MPLHRNSMRGNSNVRDLLHLHLRRIDEDKVPGHINTKKNTVFNIKFCLFKIRNMYVHKALGIQSGHQQQQLPQKAQQETESEPEGNTGRERGEKNC